MLNLGSAARCAAAIRTGPRAYARAAESLLALNTPLSELIAKDRLLEIPGVGTAIADIIRRLHATGSHPALALRKEIPEGVLAMLTIPGLRPDKVAKIYKELGIASIEELERAATEDRLKGIKGRAQRYSEKSCRVSSCAGEVTDGGICIAQPPSSGLQRRICAPRTWGSSG